MSKNDVPKSPSGMAVDEQRVVEAAQFADKSPLYSLTSAYATKEELTNEIINRKTDVGVITNTINDIKKQMSDDKYDNDSFKNDTAECITDIKSTLKQANSELATCQEATLYALNAAQKASDVVDEELRNSKKALKYIVTLMVAAFLACILIFMAIAVLFDKYEILSEKYNEPQSSVSAASMVEGVPGNNE